MKEVNGELLESPAEYHIVSEIEKYYKVFKFLLKNYFTKHT